MNFAYLDSSMLSSALLREQAPQPNLREYDRILTSDLTDIECRRTLDRVRVSEGLPDSELARRIDELAYMLVNIQVVRVTQAVLQRAREPFPTVVRTLDAIHLATAMLARAAQPTAAWAFVTLDSQQRAAASALGFAVGSS